MRLNFFILAFLIIVCINAKASAQPPITGASPTKSEDTNKPKGFFETLQKMRIERNKKDHREMLERGEAALKLSEQLEKSFSQRGHLTKENYDQISSIEKITKKIRNGLGGDDDDEKVERPNINEADAVKTLRERVINLYDELKKTTRFSISAAAIEGTNAVLKIARFFRVSK